MLRKIICGCLMEVKNRIKIHLQQQKRWPRSLNRGGRWIEVLNTVVNWQINQIGREITSGNIILDISDHYSQFCIIKSLKVKELPQKTMYRKFSSDTEENIHSELSEINWDLAMRDFGDNADAGFSKFFNSLNKIINKQHPFGL